MEDTKIPKQLSYGELVNGKCPRHKLQRRYKDCLKYNLKELDIDYNNWEESALYRSEWRKAVKDGCNLLETKKHGRAKLKHELRKGCAHNLPSGSPRMQKLWKSTSFQSWLRKPSKRKYSLI